MAMQEHISRAREWISNQRNSWTGGRADGTDPLNMGVMAPENDQPHKYDFPKEYLLQLANMFISWAEVYAKGKNLKRYAGLAPAIAITACSLLKKN